MKRYSCCCGAEIFFENTTCFNCGRETGFDHERLSMLPLKYADDDLYLEACTNNPQRYKYCSNKEQISCNWLIKEEEPYFQCRSCRLTRTIPIQGIDKNRTRWSILEDRKRRLIYNLLNHNLSFVDREADPEYGLCFDFLEDKRSNPYIDVEHVNTGHLNGVITINAAEADPDYRASVRMSMNERYRTVLGHMRHEIGHYYYDMLIKNTGWAESFYELFGDPDMDYRKALDDYYQNGPKSLCELTHITPYASMHPLEDWAETWAHYLHMKDGLETAVSFESINLEVDFHDIDDILSKWMEFTVVLNALNRSIGKIDAYPFVINTPVSWKLKMIHRIIKWAIFRA